VAVPKPGDYTYTLSGSTQSLLLNQTDPPGAVLVVSFGQPVAQAGGSQVTAVARSPQEAAVISTTYLYGSGQVAVTDSSLSYPGLATYDCAYAPPPVLLPNPLRVGALPVSSWGDAQCAGTLNVDVMDAETVTAAGQTWSVFRVHTVLQYQAQGLNATMDTTALYSPALGTVVTSDASSSGTLSGQNFSTQQVTALTNHP
jgi:hypothetical protein